MHTDTLQQPLRLLGWDDLRAKGIADSKPTIYRKIKSGRFPVPIYLGKSPSWPEHEIDVHIRRLNRAARRRTVGGA